MSVFKELMLKDYVTLAGTMFGTAAIILAILGVLEGNLMGGETNYIALASLMWVGAMTCDLLDGAVARKLKQVNQIGKEIDSLSDAVCFVVTPGVIVLCASLNSEYEPFLISKEAVMIGVFVLIFCGITRLAWFNVANKGEGYTGLVTPLSAGFFAISYPALHFFNLLATPLPAYYEALHPLSFFFTNTFAILCYLIIFGILNLAPFLRWGAKAQKRQGIWKKLIFILAIPIIFTVIVGNALPGNIFAIFVLHIFCLIFVFCILSYVIYGFINYLMLRRRGELNN
jgi:phosphatidylserine synthase